MPIGITAEKNVTVMTQNKKQIIFRKLGQNKAIFQNGNFQNALICPFGDFGSNKEKFPYLEFFYSESPLNLGLNSEF